LVSPWYCAVIELSATGSNDVLSVAVPSESVSESSKVVPLKKSTVPVGVGSPDGPETVAVNATACPKTELVGTAIKLVALGNTSVRTTEVPAEPPL
jgi:hypothetical protein